MPKDVVAFIAFFAGNVLTLYWTRKAGHGDSTEPQHVALQTRQDVGGLFASSAITNGLLAAILTMLVMR